MLYSHDHQTIVAQCTPTGSGAIALLRISGTDAIEIVSQIAVLPSKQKLTDLPSHTIHFGSVVDQNNELIDQVMFMVMHAPKTFTGQNTIEITCHNNPFIIQSIIDQIIAHGARPAQEGEFTKRAVLNNKIDLIQAETINDLIHAHTKVALKKTLAQLTGTLSHAITIIEKNLLQAIALSEASFEFIDDEITFDDQIRTIINAVLNDIAHIKKDFSQQQQIRDGVRIAIIGSVNAGKSSLFNALLGKNRAIVTNIAGTTRDSIEAGIYHSNYYLTLVDTAGLRQTDDIIEQEGIIRSFEQAALADIILLVFDSAALLSDQEQTVYADLIDKYENKIIKVFNKSDIAVRPFFDSVRPEFIDMSGVALAKTEGFSVSSKTGQNIPELENQIEEKVTQLFANASSPFLLNTRQFNLIQSIEKKLFAIQEQYSEQISHELISSDLNDALACLSELTGKDVSEKMMDAIFKEFCIGK